MPPSASVTHRRSTAQRAGSNSIMASQHSETLARVLCQPHVIQARVGEYPSCADGMSVSQFDHDREVSLRR